MKIEYKEDTDKRKINIAIEITDVELKCLDSKYNDHGIGKPISDSIARLINFIVQLAQ